MTIKAIFLDRDGTINEDIGDLYSIDKLRFIPKALESLRLFQKRFLLFIITNQAGIGKGNFTESDFLRFNREYLNILNSEGIKIEEVYYCPHKKEDNCVCRKPKTYFIEHAKEKYSLNLKESFIIGDHPSDVEMGIKLKMQSIFLLTGHGRKHLHEIKNKPDILIMDNIYYAARLIIKLTDKTGSIKRS
jgi:histidinol-phosphate phosphatase family protein